MAERYALSTFRDVVDDDDVQFFNPHELHKQNVGVEIYGFEHPTYFQLFNNFCRDLSGLDLLFNEGEMSRSILFKSITTRTFAS